MFRLHYFRVQGHPKLGSLEMQLSPEDQQKSQNPYTSVIIGMNGTGKSYVLQSVAEILDGTDMHKKTGEKPDINYLYHLRYSLSGNIYDIVAGPFFEFYDKGQKVSHTKGLTYYVNRPQDFEFMKEIFPQTNEYSIDLDRLHLPSKALACSTLPNDRFTFKESKSSDLYQYLGIRRNPRMISTKSFVRNTASYLFKASKKSLFIEDLREVLEFLGFRKHMIIRYHTKYRNLFLSGELTKKEFTKFFNNWEQSEYTTRKTRPWGGWKYDEIKNRKPDYFDVIIRFLNEISFQEEVVRPKKRSNSRELVIDIFNYQKYIDDLEIILDLDDLDILIIDSIEIKKEESSVQLEETSSGEYQIIMSLLGMYGMIENESLVLIDEPEISLHPNWQMSYIHLLKKIFRKYSDCQFIISTHSHFLISDLEKDSSSVVSLSRETDRIKADSLIDTNTFGWSAEDVLYNIFHVSTTRNLYVASEIGNILKDIAKRDIDEEMLALKVEELGAIKRSLKDNDPLKSLIDKLEKEFPNV